MAKATLTISSKNYSSWSLRGWLLTKFSGLEFDEIVIAPDDPSARAEILLLSSSILVPCLRHDGATVWDGISNNAALKQPSPLEQAGRQLTRVMESCEAQLCLLSARLAPVLDPRERPAAVGSDPGPAIPPLHGAGQLAANLHEATMRIQAIELRIQDLLDRLEL